jgi:hypothetical protein
MRLSTAREDDVVVCNGVKGIVTNRVPEDRTSGETTVFWEGSGFKTYAWDHGDLEVEVIGKGKLIQRIEMT